MIDPPAAEKLRSRIVHLASSLEPGRDALVKVLVEHEGFRYTDVVEALDGLLAGGAIKNVGGNIVSATPGATPTPAPLPARPQAVPLPAPTKKEKDQPHPVVKIKVLHEGGKLPRYADPGAAAADLFSPTSYRIESGGHAHIHTGFAMELPAGYRAVIFARSGLSLKANVERGAGLIDNSYRGEVVVKLYNHGTDSILLQKGDRFAQMSIERYEQAEFEQVDELADTSRGAGGFGSTGR